MARKKEIDYLTPTRKLVAAHGEWAVATDNEPPDSQFTDLLLKVLDLWSTDIPPKELWGIWRHVEELGAKVAETFEAGLAYKPGCLLPIDQIREHLRKLDTPRPPLESMAELRAQKVSDSQIALMYGLVPKSDNMHNTAMNYAYLVQKELDEPGSVIGPDWVDPRHTEPPQTFGISKPMAMISSLELSAETIRDAIDQKRSHRNRREVRHGKEAAVAD